MSIQDRALAQEQRRRVVSLLDEALSRRKVPALDALLALCPDEPLSAAKPYSGNSPDRDGVIQTRLGPFIIVQCKWTKRELRLPERYPGLQLDYWFREVRKYNSPYGEPLSGWIRELLITAKMHRSRAVQAHDNGWAKSKYGGVCVTATNLQFRDWLPGYLNEERWYEGREGGLRWDEAGQVVRLVCGLPRFGPTKPRRAGL